jgi:hypothetical protein
MAARRLIMVLLALLLVSSIAAALVPIERSGRDTSTTTTIEPSTREPAGKLLVRRVDPAARRTPDIRMHVGDELRLTVDSDRPDQVEIPALDLVEAVDLGAAAHFDILADQARVYPVRLVEANKTIARIVVAKPARRANGSGRRA